jgi:hypothetical protein
MTGSSRRRPSNENDFDRTPGTRIHPAGGRRRRAGPCPCVHAGGVDGTDPGPIRLPPVDFSGAAAVPSADVTSAVVPAAQTALPARAFVYSDGYHTRDRIHRISSYTMLPLFAVQAYLGQHMFNNPTEITSGMQTAHRAMGWGVAGLFGVNTVTGLWNLAEARHDPNGLGRRMVHATLMLVADAGFAATALTRPSTASADAAAIYTDKKNQHMALAYASVSVATVGYLIMIFR